MMILERVKPLFQSTLLSYGCTECAGHVAMIMRTPSALPAQVVCPDCGSISIASGFSGRRSGNRVFDCLNATTAKQAV